MKKILLFIGMILMLSGCKCNCQNFFWSYPSGLGYGYLYNWYAATDARGICSDGWHVPIQTQLITLREYLGGYLVAGGKMKETGLTHWGSPNTGADNTSKFNCRGSGWRAYYDYQDLLTLAVFHSSDDYSAVPNNGMVIYHNISNFGLVADANKTLGRSIRLLKNSTILTDGQTGTYTGNDGKCYPTICIGTQEWLARNLAETKYANGDLITVVTDNSAWASLTTEARCVYNNEEKYK